MLGFGNQIEGMSHRNPKSSSLWAVRSKEALNVKSHTRRRTFYEANLGYHLFGDKRKKTSHHDDLLRPDEAM